MSSGSRTEAGNEDKAPPFPDGVNETMQRLLKDFLQPQPPSSGIAAALQHFSCVLVCVFGNFTRHAFSFRQSLSRLPLSLLPSFASAAHLDSHFGLLYLLVATPAPPSSHPSLPILLMPLLPHAHSNRQSHEIRWDLRIYLYGVYSLAAREPLVFPGFPHPTRPSPLDFPPPAATEWRGDKSKNSIAAFYV